MNEQFTRQAQEMFNAAKDARIPDNVQQMAEDTVSKTRDAYSKMSAIAKDNAQALEDVMLAAQAGTKAIGEKILHNTETNTQSAFEAAQAIARARSIPEAARLQANFFQQQLDAAGAQAKELFELSSKVAQQTMESVNSAATKTFEQVKKTG